MPSRHKLRKSNSATIASSECSRELNDLPEKDYRQLLASVAGLPKKILASESGGLSPGAGADVVTCAREQEKLTPAAQSCLEKLVGEIRNSNTFVDNRTGKSATFDDSFLTRRIESLSAFSSTKKKPVKYEKEDMKYIDEDNDVEMMDLSGASATTVTFTRGNQEHTATEYTDDDVEIGTLKAVDATRHGFFDDWRESSLLRNGRLLNRTQTILGPQSEGSFHPITTFITGTDVIPSLTQVYEMAPLSKPLQTTPPTGNDDSSNSGGHVAQIRLPNGVTNNIEDVITKNAIQDAPNNKSELGKRKKGKKEKKENVILAENVPGHMGQLSVEQLVHLIEGNQADQNSVKKQGHKDKSTPVVEVVSEEASQTKKERRRKSKELKENTAPCAPTAATIGAQQTKSGGSAAAAAAVTVSSPSGAAQSPKMEFTVANKRVTSPALEKRRQKGGGDRHVRCSTEDGEEEFLSADEGVASSIGDDLCLPPTVSTLTMTTNTSSTVNSASDVILDGRNYRADDEDVTQIERQCADEQEFITVNTKKKKLTEPHGKQQPRTGSAGKEERHHRVTEKLESGRRSSLGIAPDSRSAPSLTSPLPSGRRPTTASLADFLDEKDGGKMQSKSFSASGASKSVKKVNRNERQSQADVEVALPELPTDQRMSAKPATQSVTSDSPERTFSYADAAKKSSEPSRDNSPACVAVASPSNKSDSPVPHTPTPVLGAHQENNSAQVLPCADIPAGGSGAADGLSFFYDDTEAGEFDESPAGSEGGAADSAFVLNLAGKTVRFAKGMASSGSDVPPSNSHHMCMVEMLAKRWKMFQEGNVPKIYQPRIASS